MQRTDSRPVIPPVRARRSRCAQGVRRSLPTDDPARVLFNRAAAPLNHVSARGSERGVTACGVGRLKSLVWYPMQRRSAAPDVKPRLGRCCLGAAPER
jgi:hypothetical protein